MGWWTTTRQGEGRATMMYVVYVALVLLMRIQDEEVMTVTATMDTIHEEFSCPEGQFQCENSTKCILQRQNCDYEKDCPNGSDEENCTDEEMNEWIDSLFRKNPHAEKDDLDPTCNLTYNGTCFCRRTDLLCHLKNYTEAPHDLPTTEIDLLDLMGSNFGTLTPEKLATLPQVKSLGLAHSNITQLEPGTFHKLYKMQRLRLENNELQEFPAGVFPDNNALTELVVRHNKIVRIHEGAFAKLNHLEELDLSHNRLKEIDGKTLEPLKELRRLHLKGNQLHRLAKTTFPPLSKVQQLLLDENLIVDVAAGSFETLPALKSLYLSNNRIIHLYNGTFEGIHDLQALTINDNAIETIEDGVFEDAKNITSLIIRNNNIRQLNKSVLQPLQKLQYIYFDRFEMCVAALHVRVCEPRGDGISSQKHLLDNPVLRTSVWVMGAVGCTGNLIVLFGRIVYPTTNVVHSLYIRNLALSDLLMGVYLFTIAGADEHYRGVYLLHEYRWRHSQLCNLCGFLSTLSCESSVLILSLVTWDRFISVTQPLARKQPSARTATLTLILLWSLAAFVALAPLTSLSSAYFGDEFYGSNGVCLSLHIHEPYAKGWEYSAVMFVLVNALALAFICYAYLRMINEIRASGVACRSTQQSQERDKVAQRFGIIVFTDCACWVPVIIVKLIALTGVPISEDLYAWLAILVLPINSALNPVLYTLTTTMFRKQVRKLLNTFVYKRTEHHSSGYDSGFSLSFGVFPIAGSTRRILSYRGTQSSSLTTSKNSWRRPTAV